jgi:hypothetical protein
MLQQHDLVTGRASFTRASTLRAQVCIWICANVALIDGKSQITLHVVP